MGFRRPEESDTWQLANEVRRRVFALTDRREFREWWLRDQLREAAHSSCSNIAEGFGRFRPREFARFLEISVGSMEEVLEHLSAPSIPRAGCSQEVADISRLGRRARGAMIGFILYLKSCEDPSKDPRRIELARLRRRRRLSKKNQPHPDGQPASENRHTPPRPTPPTAPGPEEPEPREPS